LPKHTVGFTYVLSNPAMPGMVKVGWTDALAEDCAKKLRTTGVPLPFTVEFGAETSFPKQTETAAHAMLAEHQVSADREFFRVPPHFAIEAVRDALLDAASIDAWQSEEPHRIRHDDRIALTTQAGDVFVVIAYPERDAKRALPLDLWTAHADGDLLEVFGAPDRTYVAGLSDYDPGAEIDPVPFLDRAEKRPNGAINGRERLVPGDRVLWFRPMAEGLSCKMTMFEIENYCQVISRTWSPQLTEDGLPLLLEYPAADEQPECVIRTTVAALCLPVLPSWEPRNPDQEDDGNAAGAHRHGAYAAPPEYWLPQLAQQKRAASRNSSGMRWVAGQLPLWLPNETVFRHDRGHA
jgi:T5orf172 domain